jgi:hypothetical protein
VNAVYGGQLVIVPTDWKRRKTMAAVNNGAQKNFNLCFFTESLQFGHWTCFRLFE